MVFILLIMSLLVVMYGLVSLFQLKSHTLTRPELELLHRCIQPRCYDLLKRNRQLKSVIQWRNPEEAIELEAARAIVTTEIDQLSKLLERINNDKRRCRLPGLCAKLHL